MRGIMKFKRYINPLFALLFAVLLVVNSAAPALMGSGTKEAEQAAYSELSELLGEKVVICTNSNSSKFLYSSFERLDAEKLQKLLDIAELEKNHHNSSDNGQQHTIFGEYTAVASLTTKYGIKEEEKRVISPDFLNSVSATAPPALS